MNYKKKLDNDLRKLFKEKLKSNKDFETELLSALIDVRWYHENDNSINDYGYNFRDAEALIVSMLDYAGYKIRDSIAPGFVSEYISNAMAKKGWQYYEEVAELFLVYDSGMPEKEWQYSEDDDDLISVDSNGETIKRSEYTQYLRGVLGGLTPTEWDSLLSTEEFKEEEMDIKQKSIEQIIEHHKNLGYKTDEKGYTSTNQENLLEMYVNWNEVQRELNKGDGNELKPDSHNRVKFRAVHSSSALCVNNFSLIRQHKNNVSLFGESGFTEAKFEKKFPTFLRNPVNLDFYLENDNSRIGIESKFTEILKPALPKDNNLESYIDHKRLPRNLRRRFNELIKDYLDYDVKMHLDVAQLIKHSIALSLYAVENPGKTTKLIYLYWLPLNYKDIKMYQKHKWELELFESYTKCFELQFESYSYSELWDMMEKNAVLSGILKKIKARYEFDLKI